MLTSVNGCVISSLPAFSWNKPAGLLICLYLVYCTLLSRTVSVSKTQRVSLSHFSKKVVIVHSVFCCEHWQNFTETKVLHLISHDACCMCVVRQEGIYESFSCVHACACSCLLMHVSGCTCVTMCLCWCSCMLNHG